MNSDMEVVQATNLKDSNSDGKIPNHRNSNKRRLSVSIVESEGCRKSNNDKLSTTEHWMNGSADDDPTGTTNNQKKHASDMHDMMTQDCIEWDEGRHNIDLRKLADPNFQTPLVIYGTHPTLLPTTGDEEATAGSISPKESSLLRLTLGGSTMSNNDSPVPRRRQRRRRESLDVIARHIPTNKSISTNHTIVSAPYTGSYNINKENHAAVAIVSTERHTKRYNNNSDVTTQKPNHDDRTHLQNVTNRVIPTCPSRGSVVESAAVARDGTTDFADLLHKIQTNNVVDGNPSNSKYCKTIVVANDKRGKDAVVVVQSSEDRTHHQTPIPVVDIKAVQHHHPPTLSVPKTNKVVPLGNESKRVGSTFDEFDDVTFSSDDLATIDALVHTKLPPPSETSSTTTGNNSIIAKHPDVTLQNHSSVAKHDKLVMDEDNDPFGDIPDIDIEAMLTENIKTSVVTTTIQENSNVNALLIANKCRPLCPCSNENVFVKSNGVASTESDDDQFDDLPDFDVEAFVSKQEFVLPTMTCTADNDEFPDVDFASLDLDIGVIPKNEPPPPIDAPVWNCRRLDIDTKGSSFPACSRYKVLDVTDNASTYTKTVSLAEWNTEMLQDENEKSRLIHHSSDQKWNRKLNSEDKWKMVGVIYLRGEWYYTRLQTDDTIHIVSLSGRFCTDQLPIVFHTCPPIKSDPDDDLLLIVHPDILLTPTIISETVGCSRRAVLKNRLGATGLTCT